MATVEHTEAELRAAWARYRLPCWPATYEDTVKDLVRLKTLQMHAAHLAHPPRPPGPVRYAKPARRHFATLPPGHIDHKRAAAGDLD